MSTEEHKLGERERSPRSLRIPPGSIASPFFCGAESCMAQQFYDPGKGMICRNGHRGAPSKHREGGDADPIEWAVTLEKNRGR